MAAGLLGRLTVIEGFHVCLGIFYEKDLKGEGVTTHSSITIGNDRVIDLKPAMGQKGTPNHMRLDLR